jgi:hypothetical protein
VALTITVPPPGKPAETPKGVVFPQPPALRLTAPGIDYTFGGLTTTDPSYLTHLKALFNRLAVQVEQEQQDSALKLEALASGPSVAAFVYAAWFALLARQLTNAMLQGLRNFQYDPKANAGATLAVMLADLNGQLGTPGAVDAATLLAANPRHPLNGGKALQVTGAPLTAGAARKLRRHRRARLLAALGRLLRRPDAGGAQPRRTAGGRRLLHAGRRRSRRRSNRTRSRRSPTASPAACLPRCCPPPTSRRRFRCSPAWRSSHLHSRTPPSPTTRWRTCRTLRRHGGQLCGGRQRRQRSPDCSCSTPPTNRFLAAPHLTTASVQALVGRSAALRRLPPCLGHALALHAARPAPADRRRDAGRAGAVRRRHCGRLCVHGRRSRPLRADRAGSSPCPRPCRPTTR